MNILDRATVAETTKTSHMSILSTLWIFATVNYIYCDLITVMDPKIFKDLGTGYMGGIQVTQPFLLEAAALVEIPMAMIILSRVLNYRINRWANIVAGTVMTVVQIGSLFAGGVPTMYYVFFSVIEVSTTAVVVWYAWKWPNPEKASIGAKQSPERISSVA